MTVEMVAKSTIRNRCFDMKKETKLGLIVRSDLGGGLQSQTYNLARMLKPFRLLNINSEPFNGAEQHPEMYDDFTGFSTKGFPRPKDTERFLRGLTHVLTAETFYSNVFLKQAESLGVKTFNQFNPEFCDNLTLDIHAPYRWLAPSYWYLSDMQAKYESTIYLPPPIFVNDFKEAREENILRTSDKRKFVHIVGKQASHDRNGTEDLLNALEYCNKDFDLEVRSQYPLPYVINDNRVSFKIGNQTDQSDLYRGYDAMIMPRRYGGLCLPMNEALCSGLPIIMTDISPNNEVLPEDWLVQAKVVKQFTARIPVDVYGSDIKNLASMIDSFASMSLEQLDINRLKAFEIGFGEYGSDNIKPKYIEALDL